MRACSAVSFIPAVHGYHDIPVFRVKGDVPVGAGQLRGRYGISGGQVEVHLFIGFQAGDGLHFNAGRLLRGIIGFGCVFLGTGSGGKDQACAGCKQSQGNNVAFHCLIKIFWRLGNIN